MTRLEKLQKSLPPGFEVHTWSPGDGATRYRFFDNTTGQHEHLGYFGPANGIFTALGLKEAKTFARGLSAGYWSVRDGRA
jgi:hypothetical protein